MTLKIYNRTKAGWQLVVTWWDTIHGKAMWTLAREREQRDIQRLGRENVKMVREG